MPPHRVRTISIWLNAFLPRHMPGLTQELDAGVHAGQTAIAAGERRWLLTDQRGFSDQLSAGSLSQCRARLELVPGSRPKLVQQHRLAIAELGGDWHVPAERRAFDGGHHFTLAGPGSGVPRPPRSADPPRIARRGLLVDLFQLQLERDPDAAALPESGCDDADRLQRVDMRGVVTIDLVAQRIDFDGHVDQFPAFEMYAAINDGRPRSLFRLSHATGKSVRDLRSPASRRIRGGLAFA